MTVNTSSSCSHGWRGVHVGREVLRKGMRWIVGTCTSIKVWTDPSLSLEAPMSPIGPPTTTNASHSVADLIHAESGD